jgi:hypothetical protein
MIKSLRPAWAISGKPVSKNVFMCVYIFYTEKRPEGEYILKGDISK